MSDTLTQIIDLALSKWENVLAIGGGIGGIIVLVFSYIKFVSPLITAFIHKKYGIKKGITTIDSKVDNLQESMDNLVVKVGDYVFEKFKNELDKREEQKQAVYNQIIGETEDIKQEVTQIAEKTIEEAKTKKNEIIEVLETKKEELPTIEKEKIDEVIDKVKDDVTKVVIINE